MKILNVFRSEPSADVLKMADILCEGHEAVRFDLFKGDVDYNRLVDLIFSSDKTVSWW